MHLPYLFDLLPMNSLFPIRHNVAVDRKPACGHQSSVLGSESLGSRTRYSPLRPSGVHMMASSVEIRLHLSLALEIPEYPKP